MKNIYSIGKGTVCKSEFKFYIDKDDVFGNGESFVFYRNYSRTTVVQEFQFEKNILFLSVSKSYKLSKWLCIKLNSYLIYHDLYKSIPIFTNSKVILYSKNVNGFSLKNYTFFMIIDVPDLINIAHTSNLLKDYPLYSTIYLKSKGNFNSILDSSEMFETVRRFNNLSSQFLRELKSIEVPNIPHISAPVEIEDSLDLVGLHYKELTNICLDISHFLS